MNDKESQKKKSAEFLFYLFNRFVSLSQKTTQREFNMLTIANFHIFFYSEVEENMNICFCPITLLGVFFKVPILDFTASLSISYHMHILNSFPNVDLIKIKMKHIIMERL